MATTENAWRELPSEMLAAFVIDAHAEGSDQVRFGTLDWAPNARRLVPVAEVEAELVARGRCD